MDNNTYTHDLRLLPQRGFSLIELMVALVIVGIVTSIGYPLYTDYVVRSKRSAAKVALMDTSARLERYYSRNNTYVGATLANIGAATGTDGGYYQLSLGSLSATGFSISAAPQGTQASSDARCGTLSLDQLGQRTISGTGTVAECW